MFRELATILDGDTVRGFVVHREGIDHSNVVNTEEFKQYMIKYGCNTLRYDENGKLVPCISNKELQKSKIGIYDMNTYIKYDFKYNPSVMDESAWDKMHITAGSVMKIGGIPLVRLMVFSSRERPLTEFISRVSQYNLRKVLQQGKRYGNNAIVFDCPVNMEENPNIFGLYGIMKSGMSIEFHTYNRWMNDIRDKSVMAAEVCKGPMKLLVKPELRSEVYSYILDCVK